MNMMDYIRWRGDLPFERDPLNEVDALIFSNLAYVKYTGTEAAEAGKAPELAEVCEQFYAQDIDPLTRCRVEADLELLKACAASARFGNVRLTLCLDHTDLQEETQFGAMSFLIGDAVMVAFRGTDNQMVGWLEDFNMAVDQAVPGQLMAAEYIRTVRREYDGPMYICGHSKGGNLAVFAAARTSPVFRESIVTVYNFDGPGFNSYMMGDAGYLAAVPKIRAFVPQFSVIGMLLEHEEALMVIRSTEKGIMQHDAYSWEVLGSRLVREELTRDASVVNAAMKNWLEKLDAEERDAFIQALFGMFADSEVAVVEDLRAPGKLLKLVRTFTHDDSRRRTLLTELEGLLESAVKAEKEELSGTVGTLTSRLEQGRDAGALQTALKEIPQKKNR